MGFTWAKTEMAAQNRQNSWTELVGGREWMHNALRGANSKKKKKILWVCQPRMIERLFMVVTLIYEIILKVKWYF